MSKRPTAREHIVIGTGKAGKWSDDASAVEPRDKDLRETAHAHGLFARGCERGVCSRWGVMSGEGWLLVGTSEPSDLDSDPAVIAYCEAP